MKLNELLKNKKYAALCIAAVFCGILLITFSGTSGGDAKPQKTQADGDDEAAILEQRLENVLENIKGAGKVSVFIMLDDFGTSSYVRDTKSDIKQDETQIEESTVLSGSGGNAPVLSRRQSPSVKGVIITATGAGDALVQKRLRDAAIAALAVMPHRIEVIEGK